LAATVKFTVPLALPEAPAVMVTNVALLVAVQAQPVPAVTGIDPVPPPLANVDALIAPALIVHVGVVGVVGVSSFEHADAATSTITAASRRREVLMARRIHRDPIGSRGCKQSRAGSTIVGRRDTAIAESSQR
jgi:hypothetical protein